MIEKRSDPNTGVIYNKPMPRQEWIDGKLVKYTFDSLESQEGWVDFSGLDVYCAS